jgi:hypothetical protein
VLRLAAVLFVLLTPVAEAAATVDVVRALGKRVDRARKVSRVPVLLPDRITRPGRLYPDGEWQRGHYVLELARGRDCNQATVCSHAVFMGDRAAKLFGGRKVRLAGGRTGYFTPTTCGASCAPPQIQWRQQDVLYTISVKVDKADAERATLVGLANSAIRRGPR